jgi:hypothetical protein
MQGRIATSYTAEAAQNAQTDIMLMMYDHVGNMPRNRDCLAALAGNSATVSPS